MSIPDSRNFQYFITFVSLSFVSLSVSSSVSLSVSFSVFFVIPSVSLV